MKLILCRHGETDFNTQKRLQGKLETELNERGVKQARLVAERLESDEFDCAFSSPQDRCRQTASEIMRFHQKTKMVFRNELREIDLGKYTGMNPEEIEEKFPGEWGKRVDSKYEFLHEGGESYKGVDEKRVKPLLKEFREKYSSRNVLVVTHQGIGRLIIGNLLGLAPGQKMKIDFPNECIYFIEYRPHKTEIRHCLAEEGIEGKGWLEK